MIQTLLVSIDCVSRFHSPLMQLLMPSAFLKAGMVDKRPRKHVGRSVFTDQAGGFLGKVKVGSLARCCMAKFDTLSPIIMEDVENHPK